MSANHRSRNLYPGKYFLYCNIDCCFMIKPKHNINPLMWSEVKSDVGFYLLCMKSNLLVMFTFYNIGGWFGHVINPWKHVISGCVRFLAPTPAQLIRVPFLRTAGIGYLIKSYITCCCKCYI